MTQDSCIFAESARLTSKSTVKKVCPIIVEGLAKVAEYIVADPASRGWNIYELNDFFDLLIVHCREDCVLNGVDLLASYKREIPQISGRNLATILGKYESVRAEELGERHRAVLK